LDATLRLFAGKGFQAATMRDIAAEAGCSLGLAYRYFARKEDLVLALYERLARELEEEVAALPPAPLAERFERALRADLGRIAPYRHAFAALFGVAMTPGSDVAVLGERVAHVRARVRNVFLSVVTGATDAPRPRQADDLATVLYAAHLGVVLFWLQDTSPNQRATDDLLVFARDLMSRFRPALRLPPVAKSLARLAVIIGPMFGGRAAVVSPDNETPAG
jgi:AcrR family transcriptional regulator